METPKIMTIRPWAPVTARQLGLVLAALLLVAWLRLSSPDGWVRILDDANLIFHEAGHPIFGLLGESVNVYGGTLGQLVFPLGTAAYFWRRRETTAFALCLAWVFENLLNIARYMADARAQLLPLVGGGEHDWTDIFSRWHVLPHNLAIAGSVAFIGWVGIGASGLWLAYQKMLPRG